MRKVFYLSEVVERLRHVSYQLGQAGLDAVQLERLQALDDRAQELVRGPLAIGAIDRMDLEAAIQDWLDQRSLDPGSETAALVDLGFDASSLDDLVGVFGETTLPFVLGRVVCRYTIDALLGEIGHGAERVVGIVKALKSYTYLDQAPVQSVDVHEGLDDTLVMLNSLLKNGITVRRQYDRSLPRITVHGSELNQVWTHIIDNAVSAMGGSGEIIVRSRRDGGFAVIEIIDSGPGIPAEIIDSVFDPFVTTKPIGQGTGLGLNISRNIIVEMHGGTIRVDSAPGRTCFEVRLPLQG